MLEDGYDAEDDGPAAHTQEYTEHSAFRSVTVIGGSLFRKVGWREFGLGLVLTVSRAAGCCGPKALHINPCYGRYSAQV